MRELRPTDDPARGRLVLMTAEDPVPDASMLVADFRDTHALWYRGLSGWVGWSREGLAMGRGTPELVDGTWYVDEDLEKNAANRDHSPDAEGMELRRIG